jgi:hypothetical protein
LLTGTSIFYVIKLSYYKKVSKKLFLLRIKEFFERKNENICPNTNWRGIYSCVTPLLERRYICVGGG